MTTWPSMKVGEILELSYGKPLEAKDRDDNGSVPVYGANGIKTYSTTALVNGPSIIVGRKGSAGELNLCEGPFWPLDVTYYVEHDTSKTDLYFLYYMLSLMDLPSLAKGVKPGINRNDVYSLECAVPPLEEQTRIVALLHEATTRISELTACYEQARTHANNLFTSALRDALESNPNWPVKTLGNICEVFDDGDWIESKDQAPSGVRLIQTGNVGDGEFKDRPDKARFISESTFDRLRCTEIYPGDLLVSRLPDPVGRACLIPDTGSKMITAVDCTIMRPLREIMLPQFLVLSAQTSSYREQVRAKITGTTRDRISRSNLAEVQVSVPPLEIQKQIVSRLDAVKAKTSEMVAAYEAKLTATQNLRQSILETAFAGDL